MAALTTCKACGAQISRAAKACPQCGHPAPKRTSVLTMIVGGFFVLVVGSCILRQAERHEQTATEPPVAAKPPADPARDAQLQFAALGATMLKKSAKDPDTFEMKSVVVMQSGAACYEYRARNSFNAMLAGSAIMTAKKKMLTQERDGSAFVKAWNAECTAAGGDDLLPLLKRLDIL